MTPQELIKNIELLTGININTKSRKREIVELKSLYSYLMRKRGYTLSQIGQEISLHHASVLHLIKLYEVIKNDEFIKITNEKIEYLNFGFDVESAEIKHLYEQLKIENLKLKFEIEELKSNKADDFFKNLINLANEHEDVRFKLENFYKINKQIYQKNEQRNL